jgi:hypothetical protein
MLFMTMVIPLISTRTDGLTSVGKPNRRWCGSPRTAAVFGWHH